MCKNTLQKMQITNARKMQVQSAVFFLHVTWFLHFFQNHVCLVGPWSDLHLFLHFVCIFCFSPRFVQLFSKSCLSSWSLVWIAFLGKGMHSWQVNIGQPPRRPHGRTWKMWSLALKIANQTKQQYATTSSSPNYMHKIACSMGFLAHFLSAELPLQSKTTVGLNSAGERPVTPLSISDGILEDVDVVFMGYN